jgi:hypothetical protein
MFNWKKQHKLNLLSLALLVALTTGLAGCGELSKKFIRKKPPKKEEYSFYQVDEYKAKPAPVRYQNHYILWHNWHTELERSEETSYSRDVMSANEALQHLTAMMDLLTEEQAKKLDRQISDMRSVVDDMQNRHECIKDSVRNRRTVERVGRMVLDEFSYKRMQKFIKTED